MSDDEMEAAGMFDHHIQVEPLEKVLASVHKEYPNVDLTDFVIDSLQPFTEEQLEVWIRTHAFDPDLSFLNIHSIIATMHLHPPTIRVLLEVAPSVKNLWWDNYNPWWWMNQMKEDVLSEHKEEDVKFFIDLQERATNDLDQYIGWVRDV
jgi:DNA-binding transcriptional LysR family regulator